MKTPRLILILAATAITLSHAGVPSVLYSPDKAFVFAWFDTDTGAPVGEVRTILLKPLPQGSPVFTLVTYPRDTRAFWSPDSKKCLIINGPDDGGPDTWIFIANRTYEAYETSADAPPCTVPIYPLKTLQINYYQNKGDLWRGNITKVSWADNETLLLRAWDKNGVYNITLKVNALDHPVIQKVKGASP